MAQFPFPTLKLLRCFEHEQNKKNVRKNMENMDFNFAILTPPSHYFYWEKNTFYLERD